MLWISVFISRSVVIILVLYVDGILFASNGTGLLHEKKWILSRQASFVLGIVIHKDSSSGLLGLS